MAPRETENNAYAKFWGDKQRALWYFMVFSGVVNYLFTILEKRGELEPKCVPQLFLGSLLRTRWSAIGQIGHSRDDVILLLRPESFRILLSCAN